MAYASAPITARFDVVARIRNAAAEARDALNRYRVYRSTFEQLSALSDRELADLGISRFNLRAVAYDSAYKG